MAFDPDAYIAANTLQQNTFDPDAYLKANANKLTDKSSMLDKMSAMSPKTGLFGTSVGEGSDWLAKARIPETTARITSKAMMDAIEPETKSTFLNALIRTPQTIGSIGVEGVANMISPESVVTQGALKTGKLASPLINKIGGWLGTGAEKLSGLVHKTPGVLADITNEPSLVFGPGTEAANEIYAQKVDPTQIRDVFKNTLGKKEFVEAAQTALQDGSLTADEALISRQTLDSIKNQVPRPTFIALRDALDKVAKTKFAGADKAFSNAVKSENVQNIFPLNKGGTASRLGQLVQAGGLGGAYLSHPGALAASVALSPFAQGLAASGIGAVKQGLIPLLQNPELTGIGLSALLNER